MNFSFISGLVSRCLLLGASAFLTTTALAADGMKLRFPLTGTLGAEIIAPLDHPGPFVSLIFTQIEVSKATGSDGNTLTSSQAGATPPTDVLGDGILRSASYTATVKSDAKQSQSVGNLVLGHLSQEEYLGGRLSLIANLMFSRIKLNTSLSGATPTLGTLSPSIGAPYPAGTAEATQAGVQAGFAAGYPGGLASQSAAASGTASDLGDMEITAAWVQARDNLKIMVGATLALPTGQHNKDKAYNVGFGNFYTLRPGVAVAYKANDVLTLGVRASLGLNTTNQDNQVRSGNFAGLDLAAAYLTPVGVVGVNLLKVAQYQDDTGGTLGANRFSATAGGIFLASMIPALNTGINLSYTQMLQSRNAMSARFFQAVLTKAF
jgi:hypothetical protein